MIFCTCCGKQIHESAPTCPHCGGVQRGHPPATATSEGPVWMAIVALVSGILCVLALLSDEAMDEEMMLGLFLFSLAGIVFGAISIKNYIAGKKMAITAVVLSSISFLALIGMLAP
ncbi:zinc ribbon domain-containing protein [Janthinobacterium tructae]